MSILPLESSPSVVPTVLGKQHGHICVRGTQLLDHTLDVGVVHGAVLFYVKELQQEAVARMSLLSWRDKAPGPAGTDAEEMYMKVDERRASARSFSRPGTAGSGCQATKSREQERAPRHDHVYLLRRQRYQAPAHNNWNAKAMTPAKAG